VFFFFGGGGGGPRAAPPPPPPPPGASSAFFRPASGRPSVKLAKESKREKEMEDFSKHVHVNINKGVLDVLPLEDARKVAEHAYRKLGGPEKCSVKGKFNGYLIADDGSEAIKGCVIVFFSE
jgi:hypothetical protein